MGPPPSRAPSRAPSSTCASTRSPTAATASRAWRATSSSSAARSRATACARSSPSASAPTPRRARSRCSSRAPSASRRSPTIPARRGRCCPTSASSRSSTSRSSDALTRIGQLDGFELDDIVPPSSSGATATSSSTRSARADDGTLVCGFHAPGSWDDIVPIDDCLLASERGNRAREQVARLVPRAGPERRWTAARTRACCATSSSARAGARASSRSASSPARATSTDRASPRRSTATACCGRRPTRSPRRTAGRRDERSPARRTLEEELCGLRFAISPHAFFQTNTEMAEQLYGDRRRVRRPAGLGARLRPVLRHRHDRPDARRPRRRGLGPGDRRGGRRRRDRQRPAQRDRQREVLRRRRAPRAARAGRAGRPPRRLVVDPPRAGLSQKVVRRIIEAAPRRIVYVSCNPTTLAPNAAQLVEAGYALSASSRSTCSRRRRTSSASRCSSASEPGRARVSLRRLARSRPTRRCRADRPAGRWPASSR